MPASGTWCDAPEAFDLVAVDLLRAGPALGGAQHDHRPARPDGLAARRAPPAGCGGSPARSPPWSRPSAWCIDRRDRRLRRSAASSRSPEQALQLLVGDARQQRRVVDLVAVEMQDRQHRAVADRVQELVGVPATWPAARSRLRRRRPPTATIRSGIVERGAEGVRDAVAELAALVDRARRLRRAVAADAAGEGELLEELAACPPRPRSCSGRPRSRCPRGRPAPARPARRGPGRPGRWRRGRTC